jgi:hypothetical protein
MSSRRLSGRDTTTKKWLIHQTLAQIKLADRVVFHRWLQRRLQRITLVKANRSMKGPAERTVSELHSGITLHWFLRNILRPLRSTGWHPNGRQAASSPASTGASNSSIRAGLREVFLER